MTYIALGYFGSLSLFLYVSSHHLWSPFLIVFGMFFYICRHQKGEVFLFQRMLYCNYHYILFHYYFYIFIICLSKISLSFFNHKKILIQRNKRDPNTLEKIKSLLSLTLSKELNSKLFHRLKEQ